MLKLTKMTKAIIVDRNIVFCKSFALYFEEDIDLTISAGFQELETAFNHLQTIYPNVLIIDAKLLDKEGQKIVQLILAKYPKIKCVVMTSFLGNDKYKRPLHLKVSGYLTKGNDPELLKSEILDIM